MFSKQFEALLPFTTSFVFFVTSKLTRDLKNLPVHESNKVSTCNDTSCTGKCNSLPVARETGGYFATCIWHLFVNSLIFSLSCLSSSNAHIIATMHLKHDLILKQIV